ncbi:MAG: hypothetical protein JKY53_12085 [Flavobacteriales bacterium]|nr:hypothetical protein [Flavobacteriales bacterium]
MRYRVSWLDYSKKILQKVSFDALLFTKELNKAINILTPKEIAALEKWVYETFSLNLALEAVKLLRNK